MPGVAGMATEETLAPAEEGTGSSKAGTSKRSCMTRDFSYSCRQVFKCAKITTCIPVLTHHDPIQYFKALMGRLN